MKAFAFLFVVFSALSSFAVVEPQRTPNFHCVSPKNAAQMYYELYVTDMYWDRTTRLELFYASNFGSEAVARFVVQRTKNEARERIYESYFPDFPTSNHSTSTQTKREAFLQMKKKQYIWQAEAEFKIMRSMQLKKIKLNMTCEKISSTFPANVPGPTVQR